MDIHGVSMIQLGVPSSSIICHHLTPVELGQDIGDLLKEESRMESRTQSRLATGETDPTSKDSQVQ